jgi:hypothetical protein
MTKELKVDKRGRVRFAAQGHRFEVTKSGLSVYDRRTLMGIFGAEKTVENEVSYGFTIGRIKKDTLLLIAEAVTLVNTNA